MPGSLPGPGNAEATSELLTPSPGFGEPNNPTLRPRRSAAAQPSHPPGVLNEPEEQTSKMPARVDPPNNPAWSFDWNPSAELTPTAERPMERLPLCELQPTLCILGADRRSQIEIPIHGRLSIGRDSDNEIRLADPSLSRRHAVVYVKDGVLYIEDLKSTNGTFVNGYRIDSTALVGNSQIRLGDIWILVRYKQVTVNPPQKEAPPPKAQLALGDALRAWRQARGLTQMELSVLIGVSQRAVSLWEQGAPISAENLRRLREQGGCDLV